MFSVSRSMSVLRRATTALPTRTAQTCLALSSVLVTSATLEPALCALMSTSALPLNSVQTATTHTLSVPTSQDRSSVGALRDTLDPVSSAQPLMNARTPTIATLSPLATPPSADTSVLAMSDILEMATIAITSMSARQRWEATTAVPRDPSAQILMVRSHAHVIRATRATV